MGLSDEAIVAKVRANLEHCEPAAVRGARVVDAAVLRFQKAVTHFSVGSHASRPTQAMSVRNVFMAGDWVKDVEHGAEGLSQVPPGYRSAGSSCLDLVDDVAGQDMTDVQVSCKAWHGSVNAKRGKGARAGERAGTGLNVTRQGLSSSPCALSPLPLHHDVPRELGRCGRPHW